MPRAKEKSSEGLSIELLDKKSFYTPGSQISGVVTLNTAQDFAIGSVTLEFYGRVKVFFVYSHGQGESHWRGRAPLFQQTDVLYSGYHTHKPGTYAWNFVVELPKNPDMAVVRQCKHQWKEREHFLATDDYIPGHAMPPTFRQFKWGFGYRYHAFTEYVIRVSVKEAPGASMIPSFARKATLPVLVQDVASSEGDTVSLPCAIEFTIPQQLDEKGGREGGKSSQASFEFRNTRETIRSSKLLSDKRLSGSFSNSIRDKAKAVISPDTLPRFTFNVTIATPSNVRLMDPDGIAFFVDVNPVRDDSLTTISQDIYPEVRIDNITLIVESSTYIRFKSILGNHTKTKYDITVLDRHPVNHVIDMDTSKIPETGFENEWEAKPITHTPSGVDISKLPAVSTALVSAKIGRKIEKPLTPTFNTYIIAREYRLKYKLELDVAGEKVKIASDDKIGLRILPALAKDLESILEQADATKAEMEDGDEDESDDESTEVRDEKTASALLRKLGPRRTKQEEAAEEEAAAESSAAGAGNQEEALPSYQPNPTDFGFRNQIDDRPPRYEPQ